MSPRFAPTCAALAAALALAASCGSAPASAPTAPTAAPGPAVPEAGDRAAGGDRALDAEKAAATAEKTDDGAAAPEPVAVEVLHLPAPPMTESLATRPAGAPAPRAELRRRRVETNAITDEDAWLRDTGLTVPDVWSPTGLPPGLETLDGLPATRILHGELLVYAVDDRTVLAGLGAGGELEFAFDLSSYRLPYHQPPADPQRVAMDLRWAVRAGDVLYVSHAHPTYAKSSGGDNAYVTALAIPTGDLLWRSRPLVANARTFALVGDVLVTGYGFTAEDDFLYVLDAGTGAVVDQAKLRSGPSYILADGDLLHVRTYNRNYVFALDTP